MRSGSQVRLALCASLVAGCSLIWPAHYKLKQADELEAKGRYPEAVALYEEVFTKYPKKTEALKALERAAALYDERLNNWQKAAGYLQDLRVRTEGRPEHASVLLRLGRVLERAGSPFKDSLETYGILCKSCASAPEAVSALLSQGRLHEAMQNWPAAKSVYEEAIAKLGKSPEAATVRVRLESVWQMEAVGMYYAGSVDDAIVLAQEAMKKGITVVEIRNGLEALLKRYANAQLLWKARAEAVAKQDSAITDRVDPSFFVHRFERGAEPAPPEGWAAKWDPKRKTLTVTEVPPEPPGEIAVAAARKPKTKAKPARKPWSWKSPAEVQVLGYWWSPEGRLLGWIGKSRTGKRRTLNIVDLAKRRSWVLLADPGGSVLGEVMAFLPRADKVVFPYEDYFAVSDLRGGVRNNFPLAGDPETKSVYRGREVEWMATTADGLEVVLAVNQPLPKARGKTKVPAEPKRLALWKVGLGVGTF